MSKYHNQVIIVILKSFNNNYYNKHDQLFRSYANNLTIYSYWFS